MLVSSTKKRGHTIALIGTVLLSIGLGALSAAFYDIFSQTRLLPLRQVPQIETTFKLPEIEEPKDSEDIGVGVEGLITETEQKALGRKQLQSIHDRTLVEAQKHRTLIARDPSRLIDRTDVHDPLYAPLFASESENILIDEMLDELEQQNSVGTTETFTSQEEQFRIQSMIHEIETQQLRPFQPSLVDSKQSHIKIHEHDEDDELGDSTFYMAPQFIRKTSVDYESGQIHYELIYPMGDLRDKGDVVHDILIRRLPNTCDLYRISIQFGENDRLATIQYTLGNLPPPERDGSIHLDFGDSPLYLFKMLGEPKLIFSYDIDPNTMPVVLFELGKLTPKVKESVRRIANLATPFDNNNQYLLYSIWNRHNIHLIRLPERYDGSGKELIKY